jgi:ribosomal protein S6--L-glutamate ligase
MMRKGKFWKANVQTTDFVLVEPEHEWTNQIKKLQQYLKADIVAIDMLEAQDGNCFVVEYNDIPGLSGFPEEAKAELAACVRGKKS